MNTKHIIAVLLADPTRAQELAASLSDENVEAVVASNSDEICQILNYRPVDLVVIEHDLQGFFRGMEILERIYDDLLRPATILLAERPESIRQRAQELHIEQVLPIQSPPELIRKAVRGLLTAGRFAVTPISADARRLVQECGELRPLPQVLVKISSYLDLEQASLPDLAKDISLDARITADLLTITNSACMGLRRKFSQVSQAVSFLGIRRTVSLVLSATVARTQQGLAKELSPGVCNWYNRRSVLIAGTASAFANRLEKISPENSHLLGLFQDLGILILAAGRGSKYTQLIERVNTMGQLRLDVCERQTFGLTHADVSAALLQKWGLPTSLVSLVAAHHTTEMGHLSDLDRKLIHVMQIGEAVSNLTDCRHPRRRESLNRLLAHFGPDKMPACRAAFKDGITNALEAVELFSIPIPKDGEMEELAARLAAEEPFDLTDLTESSMKPSAAESAPEGSLAPATGQTSAEVVSAITAGEKSILVIQNDPALAESITRTLTTEGFEVLACAHSDRAQLMAPQAQAILCDFRLDAGDGAEIITTLRQGGFRRPVIMMSEDRTRAVVNKCIKAGITDFLPKPFTAEALLEKIGKHLASGFA